MQQLLQLIRAKKTIKQIKAVMFISLKTLNSFSFANKAYSRDWENSSETKVHIYKHMWHSEVWLWANLTHNSKDLHLSIARLLKL
jgi:hypothetical protein